MFLKFWRKYCFCLLPCFMDSLICILLVSILIHLLLHHHWLLMSLMSRCGPSMEMTFMFNALRFMNLLLTFLLIILLLIIINYIFKLISLFFILLYCILKQMVICVNIFFWHLHHFTFERLWFFSQCFFIYIYCWF